MGVSAYHSFIILFLSLICNLFIPFPSPELSLAQ